MVKLALLTAVAVLVAPMAAATQPRNTYERVEYVSMRNGNTMVVRDSRGKEKTVKLDTRRGYVARDWQLEHELSKNSELRLKHKGRELLGTEVAEINKAERK